MKRLLLQLTLVFVGIGHAVSDTLPIYAGAVLTTRGAGATETSKKLRQAHLIRVTKEVLSDKSLHLRHIGQSNTPQTYSRKSNLCKSAKIRRLMQNTRGRVVCSPNWVVTRLITPNDSFYPVQYGFQIIQASLAWDQATGNPNYSVAIIDSGISYTHPDIGNSMWINSREIPGNRIDDDRNGVVDDIHGFNVISGSGNPADDNSHGTHVAGIVGAQTNNSRGVAGLVWGSKLIAVKFLSSSGIGSTANAIKGIVYVNNLKKQGHDIKAINASWGGGGYSQAMYDAIEESRRLGIVFVAAAGNATNNNDLRPFYPASYQIGNIIAVASVDGRSVLSTFSNYGAQSVHIAAPGNSIFSAVLGTSYGYKTGTSMAAPHVAGAVVLVQSACSGVLQPEIVKNILLSSGVAQPSLMGKVTSASVLNVKNAIDNARGRCDELYATPTPLTTPVSTNTPTPVASQSPTPTVAPTPTQVFATPTPTRTPTATLALAQARFSPNYVAPLQSTTLQIKNISTKHAYITVRFVVRDGRNRNWYCAGKRVAISSNKNIPIRLSEAAKNFTSISALIQTPVTVAIGRLSINGTTSWGANSTLASGLCKELTKQVM